MPGCDSQGLGLSVKHNFENGGARGRAQNFVLLPVLSLADIFRKQNIRVVVAPTAAEVGSTVAAFLDDEMSAISQFHFAS